MGVGLTFHASALVEGLHGPVFGTLDGPFEVLGDGAHLHSSGFLVDGLLFVVGVAAPS